jgi:hypothetical protein
MLNYKEAKLKMGALVFGCAMLAGCPIDGDTGNRGLDGIDCWDINENRVNDSTEDINGDGIWDVNDCSPRSSANVSQNPSVDLNHQHICEALANLGQYPEGCPSNTHTTPVGTLRPITAMLDDGSGSRAVSCNYEPDNGLLTLEQNPIDQQFYWKLEGGFVAGSQDVSFEDELTAAGQSCFDICQSDPECVASLALSKTLVVGGSIDISYRCNTFHHSDTVQPFERLCGNSLEDCGAYNGALQAAQRWSVICP